MRAFVCLFVCLFVWGGRGKSFECAHTDAYTHPTPTSILRRLDEALEEAAAHQSAASKPQGPPALLPPEHPEALVTVAWDARLFGGPQAIQQLVGQMLQAVEAGQGDEGGGAGAEEGLARLLEEGLAEALGPFAALVTRAWAILQERLVAQCAAALQGVKGITATYRMTNKRPPERACPYVARVLDPLKALEPDVKGR